MNHEICIDDNARFQLPSDELAGFVEYLRLNEVPCDVDEADTFLADGRLYGFIRLRHLYDCKTAEDLYSKWREAVV